MTETYFYEPAMGHGLAHDPFNAIIGPRPIGWVSTKGNDGSINLAPYSFFNAFNYTPPIIGFSSIGRKDSMRNVEETGEFVWNITTKKLAEQMNKSCASVAYGVDEFELADLTKLPSRFVAPPRVAESPVNFECKLVDIVRLKTRSGEMIDTWLVLGEVVGVHIQTALLKDGVFDTFGAGIVLRAGGPSSYAAITPDTRFEMFRPSVSPAAR